MRSASTLLALAILAGGAPSARAQSLIRVPADMGLQAALDAIPDGGIVEISAGTYSAPANAFQIADRSRGFTVRAASGAAVTLTGGNANRILLLINSNPSLGRPVVFENLTFANGYSATDGQAGGVTLQRAEATFVGCVFTGNNGNAPSVGGGATLVGVGSRAFFLHSSWTGNRSKNAGAAMDVGSGSEVFIHDSDFQGNRTNFPGHHPFAAGGAIHIGDSNVRIANSRFLNNEAGYVGGGVYVIGTWAGPVSVPAARLTIVNSYFEGNKAKRDAAQVTTLPTEAGAVHGEDQSTTRVYYSRFVSNQADTGGAVNAYRAEMEVYSSVFKGNTSAGTPGAPKFGGTFNAISGDGNDATTAGGTINRRSVKLTIHDSLVQGRLPGQTTIPDSAGCVLAGGDANRMYGENGVSQMGTLADNRAVLDIRQTVFFDCDAGAAGAIGGGIQLGLASLTLADSIIVRSNSVYGGGIAALIQSAVTVTNSTIADNAATYGGGLFVQGSTVNVSGSRIVRNSATTSGSALHSEPDSGRGLRADGLITGNTISENTGATPLGEYDANNAVAYNAVQYDANVIPNAAANAYSNSLAGLRTVSGLNALVVSRTGGAPSTDKSPAGNNTAPAGNPVLGQVVVTPPGLLSVGARNEAGPFPAYVGYAWGGSASATLNGAAKAGGNGLDTVASAGTQTLQVSASTFTDDASSIPVPSTTLVATPPSINAGTSSTLWWNTVDGTVLEVAIDHGVGSTTFSSGGATVTPAVTTTYRSLALAQEGGADASATVTVAGAAPIINYFTASPSFVNPGQSSTLAWSVSAGASVTFNGVPVATSGSLVATPGGTTTYNLLASNTYGTASKTTIITVNTGGAGLGTPAVTAPVSGQVIGVNAVTFAWGAVGGAAGYGVKVWDAPTGMQVFSGSLTGGGSTSTIISLPVGSYRFAVRACNAGGFTDGSCGQFGTVAFSISLISPTGTPTVTSPSNGALLTGSTVTFQWTAVAGNPALSFLKYEVLVRNTGNGKTELQTSELSPSLSTVYSLGSGSYEVKVRACQAGCGPYSSPVSFTVDLPAVPASAPLLTGCTVSGGNSLTCTWTAVAGADLYRIQVVQPNTGPGGGALTVAARQVGATTATFPVPSGPATVVIAACNGDGCGPQGGGMAINPAGPNPSLPAIGTPMLGSVVSGPYVLFTWSRVPGDTGTNTTYRLYVRDFARQETALDVLTSANFYGALLKAEGTRYDSVVIVNPDANGSGPSGPATGFNLAGSSATAPTMVLPTHNSTVKAGNVSLGWTPVLGATLYEYYVASGASAVTGVTPGLLVQVPLVPTGQVWNGIARACPSGATCVAGSDAGWGPWSTDPGGPGITKFTVVP